MRLRWETRKLTMLPLTAFMLLNVQCHFHASFRDDASQDWAYPGGSAGQSKYSGLDQINVANVAALNVAWVYHSGDTSGGVECTPLIVNGIMYITTPSQQLISINAADGKERWRFDPARTEAPFDGVNRGIAYFESERKARIFYTSGNFLNSIVVPAGKVDSSFGDNGTVRLNKALSGHSNTSPAAPVLYKNLVIVGVAGGPGEVQAYDVNTGGLAWTFHTIPHPGEYGYDTWEDKEYWRTGDGVAVWGGLCVDERNGIVYFSTGQPRPNFYRPDDSGRELFANCIVAVKALTGQRIWSYQALHHDLWDLDLASPPILVHLRVHNRSVPGVMQLSKTGNIFLFNRLTGELLSKVTERPVPRSKLPGEHAYPTQPDVGWPEPFSRQVVKETDLTDRTPESHAYADSIYRCSDVGWFVPPSVKGILYYGIHGGAEWCGGAYDDANNTLYVTANELAWLIRMKDISGGSDGRVSSGRQVYLSLGCVNCHGTDRQGQEGIPDLNHLGKKYGRNGIKGIVHNGRGTMPAFSRIKGKDLDELVNYLLNMKQTAKEGSNIKPQYRSAGYVKFLDRDGYPATKPPWGTLNAVDLTSGRLIWKVPLGVYPELVKQAVPVTGTENFGGCIATAGGLVFVAATRDRKFRAFDQKTGKELWEAQLPYGGYSTPATYSVKGEQFVVIAATAGGKLGPPSGDTYIAFSLPADGR